MDEKREETPPHTIADGELPPSGPRPGSLAGAVGLSDEAPQSRDVKEPTPEERSENIRKLIEICDQVNADKFKTEALRLFTKYPRIVGVLQDVERVQAGKQTTEEEQRARKQKILDALKLDLDTAVVTKEVDDKKYHVRALRELSDGDVVLGEEVNECAGEGCAVCQPFGVCSRCDQDTYRGWCQNCQAGGSATIEGGIADNFRAPYIPTNYHLDDHTDPPSALRKPGDDRLVLIGLAGFAGSGKNTAADFLTEEFGFQQVAFADALKEAAGPLFGFTDAQLRGTQAEKAAPDPFWGFSARWAMQRFGTEAMRGTFGHDFWVRVLRRRLPKTGLVVVTDVRFENEAEMVRELGGEVWLVDRTPPRSWWQRVVDRAWDLLGFTHASERLPRRLDLFDRVVDNHGDRAHLRDGVLAAYAEMVTGR